MEVSNLDPGARLLRLASDPQEAFAALAIA